MNIAAIYIRLLTMFVSLLLAIPVVMAPSHPVFTDSETGETIDEILGDPGTTPDSGLYRFERWWENIQIANADNPEEEVALLHSLTQERYAEFHAMIEKGNYDVAESTTAEIEELKNELIKVVEGTEATGENIEFIHEIEKALLEQEDLREMLEQNMENLVAIGELSSEQAASLASMLEEHLNTVQIAVEAEEEEITDAIAEEQGITHLEAEFQVEEQEEQQGLAEQHQEEVTEELAEAQQQVEQLEEQLAQAAAEGREIPPAATELIAEAQARLEQCQDALAERRYGESFGQFTAAEHLIDNAQHFLDRELSSEEMTTLVGEAQQERITNHQQFVREYEKNAEEWDERFPEQGENFDRWYKQGQKAIQLADTLKDVYTQESERLKSEGKNDAEIFEILTQSFTEEYERVYGEPFVPPVIEVEGGIGDLGNIEDLSTEAIHTSGGFVEGYQYTDPVTGYAYEFNDDGYTYTTLLGATYDEKFPEGFTFPKAYETGTEKHTYVQETPDGKIEHNYYATGYEIVKPDGTKESFSYSPGKYELPEGGMFIHDPTGFEYRHEGEAEHFDYNPKYDTYVSKEGEHFKPPEGVYFHEEFDYDYSDKKYEVEHDGETWSYDPATDGWSSSTGESYTPEAHIVAPVGHEKEGSFETETGESWTYDPVKETWKTSTGEKYHPESGTWESGAGKSYDFDHATGKFVDPNTGKAATDVVWSGATWTYDASTNAWSSSAGESYSGSTSEAAGEGVPSGLEGHVDSSGHPYSGDSSSTGSYSGGESGSYSGGDSGSSSGGDGGGSAPSGGDGGGHSGGDGGGGGTGHVVREPLQGEELHPVTKWILKYLGVKH